MEVPTTSADAPGGFNTFREVPPSPVAAPEKSSRHSSFSCHCIVEDVHGRPASRTLSLSATPERAPMSQFCQQQVSPGSAVNPVYHEEVRLSNHGSPPIDAMDFFDANYSVSTAEPAWGGDAGVQGNDANAFWAATAVVQHRSETASQSCNEHTTTAHPVSKWHVTQNGIVIPPIQGIPQPKELPPPTLVQYAKVKRKGRAGPKRLQLAVKGAFSNMTSVAVLQQVLPFHKKTRQVEAAGWSKLNFTAGNESEDEFDNYKNTEDQRQRQPVTLSAEVRIEVAVPHSSLPATSFTSANAGGAAAAAAGPVVTTLKPHEDVLQQLQQQQQDSGHHHSCASSAALQTPPTPSEAAMVLPDWEEDMATTTASAARVQQQMSSGRAPLNGSGYVDDQDDWDCVEAKATRIQARMLQQQQQRQLQGSELLSRASSQQSLDRRLLEELRQEENQQKDDFTPATPTQPQGVVIYSTPVAVQHNDPSDEIAPYAIRTAASAKCSPTASRIRPVNGCTPNHDIYSAHRLGSHDGGDDQHRNSQACSSHTSEEKSANENKRAAAATVVTTPAGVLQHRNATKELPKAYPTGFEAYAQKGQQRRAEAERTQLERAAEAAGEPSPFSTTEKDKTGNTNVQADLGAKRTLKMSVLPPPRGYEAFAQKGYARRREVEREEERRQQAEVENCTYVPRINQRRSTSAGTGTTTICGVAAGASLKASHTITTTTGSAAAGSKEVTADNDGESTRAVTSSALSVTPSVSPEPHVSVFDRLSREAQQREERMRLLGQKYTPSFVPQLITATAAVASAATADRSTEVGKTAHAEDQRTAAARHIAKPRDTGRNVFEDLYSLSKKQNLAAAPTQAATALTKSKNCFARTKSMCSATPPDPAAAGALAVVPDASEEQKDNRELMGATAVGKTANSAEDEANAKRSEAEIEQYIVGMLRREEERRAQWEQQQATKAAAEQDRLNHPTLNPKTGELAERARARYRMREEQRRLQEAEEAKQQQEKKAVAQRIAKRRQKQRPCLHSQQQQQPNAAKERDASHATLTTTASANTPTRRSPGSAFYEHQQKNWERKRRQLEQLRLQQVEEELKECTFHPRLNTTSVKIAQRVFVESYGIPADDGIPRTFYSTSKAASSAQDIIEEDSYHGIGSSMPRSVDFSCHNSHSAFVSVRSRSLLRGLSAETPTQGPTRRDRSSIVDTDAGALRERDEEEKEYPTLHVKPIHFNVTSVSQLRDSDKPQRSPEPFSVQLRNLEEMLREWKELERECSPMLRQRPEADLVELQ